MPEKEYERQIRDDALQLECRLDGYCPVQAEGTVRGKRLYFRARWHEWSFSVADSEDVDPVDIDFPEQGFLREGFLREGQYGEPDSCVTSWMDYDDAEAIIRQCAQEYIASRT